MSLCMQSQISFESPALPTLSRDPPHLSQPVESTQHGRMMGCGAVDLVNKRKPTDNSSLWFRD